jgi:ParB family chromosome partitioning protein
MKGVEELAESLRTEGLLQPIIVTKAEGDDNFKIIAGERRFHAARILGWEEIECKILNKNDKDTYRIAVIENLQRENLSPYDEIEAFKVLKQKFSYTDSELAALIGKSRNYMNEILSVSTLNVEQLNDCKESGIDNKNLLVQAAQALKKGDFNEFIENFKKGNLRTVKDAKEFNKSKNHPNPLKVDSLNSNKSVKLAITNNSLYIKSKEKLIIQKLIPIVSEIIQKNGFKIEN